MAAFSLIHVTVRDASFLAQISRVFEPLFAKALLGKHADRDTKNL